MLCLHRNLLSRFVLSSLIPIIIIFSILQQNITYSQSISADVVTTTINANSVYKFVISDTRLQSSNGFIMIGFPSSLYTLTGLSCFNTDTPAQTYTCSVTGSTVVVTYTKGSFPSPYMSISISSIKNPGAKQSLNFTYAFSGTSTLIAAQAFTYINPLTPDSLISCSVAFTPSTVNTQGTATFSFVTKNLLDSQSSITITLPSSWSGAASTSYKPMVYSTTTCTKISGTQLKSALTCNVLTTDQKIYVYQAFSATVPTSSSVSFSSTRIRSPPTTSSGNTVTITTQTSNGYPVDQSQCTVVAVSQQTISPTSSSTFVVGNSNALQMTWVTASPLKVNDIITITLPSTYMQFVQYSSSVLYYDSKPMSRSITVGTSTQQIKYNIDKLFLSETQILTGSVLLISNIVVQNLFDTSPRSVSILISRGGFNIATGTVSLTPTANVLTSSTISSDISIVSSPMNVNISFVTTNILTSTGSMKIQIPSSITLTGTAPSCSVSSSTTPSAIISSVSCTLASLVVTIPSFLQSTLPANSSISVTISNAFINPQTTQPTTAFVIGTYSTSASTYLVDQTSSLTYAANPGTIASLTITPNSLQVGATTQYIINYNILRTIKSGSTISIKIPAQISLLTNSAYSYMINNVGSYSSITPTLSITPNTVLTFSGIITTQLNSSNNIKIKLTSVQNPLSTKTISSFQVSTQYNGYSIQSLSAGLTTTMTILASWREIQRAVALPTNGATQDYTFYLKPSVAMSTNDQIIVEIVNNTGGLNQLQFTSSISTCMIYYNTVVLSNPCTVSSTKLLTITLAGPLSDTTGTIQYRLVISSVKMARTPTTTSKFKFTSYTALGFGVQATTIDSIINTQPNKIQQLTYTNMQSVSQLNTLSQVRVYVKTLNGLDFINGQYLVIQVPASFAYVGNASVVPICTNTIYSCSYYNSNNNAIKVSASASFTTIGYIYQFTVTLNRNLYVTPTAFGDYSTDYFDAKTYTTSQLLIDKTYPTAVSASATYFYRTCGGNCKTCLVSNTSYCVQCYHVGDGYYNTVAYGGYNTMTSDHRCVDVCGDGYYNNSGSCILCTSPCAKCISATQCTSCRTGFYYVSTNPSNNKCVSTCPQKSYADSTSLTCLSCSTSCYNCTSTSTTCISCATGLYLSSSSTCVSTCTAPFTYQDTVNNRCASCDYSCNTATGCNANATDCITCAQGYSRANATSSQCVNSCPTGTVNNTATGVCECSSSCATCSGLLTNCLSCQSTLFLYNGNCISSCPAQTYQPTGQQTCLSCTDTHCTMCNATSCLKCTSSYYLYLGTCITVCPSGTRIENYECVLCQPGCKVCLNATVCTSCFSSYLLEQSKCVSACSAGFINFNATVCVTSCPTGYYNSSNKCQLISNNTNNNSNNNNNNSNNPTSVANASLGKIVPFPYTIAYILLLAVCIGMRCLYPATLLPSLIMSVCSILQIMAIITIILVDIMQEQALSAGLAILIISIVLIYLNNVVAFILVVKYLSQDNKYSQNYKKTVCGNKIIRAITVITYHKFHQIIFTNAFGIKVLCNKVQYVRRLRPFNILLIISLFISALTVIGASLVSYSVQDFLLSSGIFIQSVDCIVVVVLNVIPTVLVLRRKDTQYENDISDSQAKRYETQDQLNANNQSVGIQQAFIEESGALYGSKVTKVGNQNRKNYFYQNSKRSQAGEDVDDTPLDKKKIGSGNPIVGGSGVQSDGQQSSDALFFGEKKKNKGMGSVQQISQGIQEITLQQPGGDNAANPGNRIKNTKLGKQNGKDDPMLNYTGYDLDPKLLLLPQNSEQFKKLPSQTKAKIRLAKANIQINKNGKNIKQSGAQDVEQIQLSPKKNKSKIQDELKGSMSNILDNNVVEQMDQQTRKQNKSALEKNGLRKSKSKSKQKDKNRSKSKSIDKKDAGENKKGGEGIQNQDDQNDKRMIRNRSEQMQKKQGKQQVLKTTKSQNIKKKKKNLNTQIKVLYNNGAGNANPDQQNIVQNEQDYEQDEPTLPVFRHRNSKGKIGNNGDGLDETQQYQQMDRGKRDRISDRKSENLDDYNLNNLRNVRGDKPMQNQQPDDLPQLHSSQQLGKLIVVNKQARNRRSKDLQFSNDDSSIYKKIYNDDDQTLKSVQGDNFFGQQVSPSQFNIQNQRFSQTQASNEMPIPPSFDFEQLDDKGINKNRRESGDGFDDQLSGGSYIKRYSSNNNIDYDSVLSKKVNDDRIKQLEKIYLPRLEVVKPSKKKK